MEVRKGKKIYKLSDGDFILFNGACWMFKPKNKRILPFAEWHYPDAITISKKEAMRILTEYPYFQKEVRGLMFYKITNPLTKLN